MVPRGLSGEVHGTQRRGCLCESVALLIVTLTSSPRFRLHFPFPFTPETAVTGQLCLRALFSRGAREDNGSIIEVTVVHSLLFLHKETRLDNGNGITVFIREGESLVVSFSPSS